MTRPPGGHTPEGESPSNPVGVSRAIKFGGTSIYEFDTESPIGEHGEYFPTPVANLGPADSGHEGGPMPADLRTTNRVEGLSTPTAWGDTLG